MRRSFVGAAGAVVAASLGTAAVRRSRKRYACIDEPQVERPDEPSGYPIVIHRIDGFATVHSARFEAIREVLPSNDLHPVRLPNGRALVGVGLFQKRAASAGSGTDMVVMPPYAELPIWALVARRPLSPMESVLALIDSRSPDLGAFALQFPLTSKLWRDAARSAMGAPMFVADFALDLSSPAEWRLRVSEEDRTIVAVRVRAGGRLHVRREASTIFGALDGRLLAASQEAAYVAQQRWRGGLVEFGDDHPVGAALSQLDIAPRAVAAVVYRSGWVILHAPAPVGQAKPYPAHTGIEAPFGHYTIRYPGTGPVDQYSATNLRPDRLEAASAADVG